MPAAPDDASLVLAERELMDALFGEIGRSDPHAVLRDSAIPGCRYSFVREVLHDRRFVAPRVPATDDALFHLLARFLPRLPPERHDAVRRRFSGLFSVRRVGAYRERIRARTDELLEAMDARGEGDLVADFARPLPFGIIADVLGVPAERQDGLGEALAVIGRGFAGQRTRGPVDAANAAVGEVLDLFNGLLAKRRVEPREDLLSLLAAAPSDDEGLHHDLLANCVFFLLAGHATTTTMLCGGVLALADHPDQLRVLLEEPQRWESAIEEVLRFVSPITLTGVLAQEDAVVDGCPVAAGQQRTVVYAAANRDPAAFAEPELFDTARSPNPHLAFSAGATFCLGAPLARLHGSIALPALFTRMPALRPAGPPVWRGSTPVRQIERMPVCW